MMNKEVLKKIRARKFDEVCIETPDGSAEFNKDDITYIHVDTYDRPELFIEGETKSMKYRYFKSTDYNENDLKVTIKSN